MTRCLELRLLIVVLVTAVMGHFFLNNRTTGQWDEALNQAFSEAWRYLGDRHVGEAYIVNNGGGQDLNNNNNVIEVRQENGETAAHTLGIQRVWGEESFRDEEERVNSGGCLDTNED